MSDSRRTYLGPEWMDAALALADEWILPIPGLDLILETIVPGLPEGSTEMFTYIQRWVDGRLVEVRPGQAPDGAIRLIRPLRADFVSVLRPAYGTLGAGATVMEFAWNSQTVRAPLPPFTHLISSMSAQLPRIPGANVRMQCQLNRSPFGDLEAFAVYEDGLPRASGFGRLTSADVVIESDYATTLRFIAGEASPPELLETGNISGDLTAFSILQGIVMSEEMLALARAFHPVTTAFERLTRIAGSSGYAAWRTRLATVTRPLV